MAPCQRYNLITWIMSYFRHVCLVEAPPAVITPFPRYITDCIGICYLAAAILDEVDSLVIPENYYNDALYDSFTRLLESRSVDLVAISSMTGCFSNALRLAEIAKRKGVYVVMGGFHPTACPDEVLATPVVDAVILGEGEVPFRELVRHGPGRSVPGFVYREGGGLVSTARAPLIRDIDSIPFPLRSLRPARYGEKGEDYTIDTIYTSRGCPWNCSFCANEIMHGGWRGRSPENVVDEIALLHDPGKKKLLKIWDANFLTNIKRAESICNLMLERGLTNFRIMTETRARDIVRAEHILDKLYRVGLRKVGLGIESPNEETLALMNKKNVRDDIHAALGLLRKHGIGAEGYFVIGHYTESMEDTMKYPAFAKGLGLRQALFMSMTPYPGTRIFKEYSNEDRISSTDWDLYNNFCPVISTRSMDTEQLLRMLVYCNLAFSGYRSMLKRNSPGGMLVVLLKDLLQLCFLLRANKSLGNDEMVSVLSDALKLFAQSEPVFQASRLDQGKVLNKPVVLAINSPAGEVVEFILEQNGDIRTLGIRNRSGTSSRPVATINLEKVVAASGAISMSSLMQLLYRNELYRNNRRRIASQIFPTVVNPLFWTVLHRFSSLYLDSLRKR